MNNGNFYDGGGLNISGAPMGQMQAHKVEAFAMEDMQRANLNRSQFLGKVEESFGKMLDYKAETEGGNQLEGVQIDTQARVKRGLEAAPGSADSFLYEDGSINESAINDFAKEVEGKLDSINPSFINPFLAEEFAKKKEAFSGNLAKRITGQAQMHQLQAIRRTSEAALALCVEKGDYNGAACELDKQVEAGIMLPKEAQAKKLQLGRVSLGRSVSGGGRVNIGGTEYEGDSAALAVSAAREGYAPAAADEEADTASSPSTLTATEVKAGDSSSSGEFTLPEVGVPEAGSATGLFPEDGEAGTLQVPAVGSQSLTLPGDSWHQQGDFGGIIRTLPMVDALAMQDELAVNTGVAREVQPDGTTRFSCRASAGDATQRMVAVANIEGEINPETARAMVANIAIASIYENPDATPASIVAQFKDSGVFEALGEGNSETGKIRVEGIVKEFAERGKLGTTKLNLDAIRDRVVAHVGSDRFGKDKLWEWKRMEALRPPDDEDGRFDKPEGAAGRAHWFELYRIYEKYRDQFNPKQAHTALDKDEFEEKAHAFYTWYMGKSKIYSKQKKAYQDAAVDWYMARIGEALVNNLDVTEEGKAAYGSYASDLDLVDSVLDAADTWRDSMRMPRDMGVEAMQEQARVSEQQLESRREVFRGKAAEDYAALNEARRSKVEEKSRKKSKEADEKRRAQEREKEERRSILRERAKPRRCAWEWDRQNDDTSPPFCEIPEAEYHALIDKMGCDGLENVYVRVNGLSIPVVGYTKGKTIRLNTAAAMKVQPGKGRRKRGAMLQTHGTLGYTYTFRNNK